MSTIASPQPTIPTADPGWIPSRLYRMTVEQYEAMAASGAIPTSHRVHFINGYLVEKMTQKPPHVISGIWRSRGGGETYDDLELLHAQRHRQIHGEGKADGLGCVPRGAFVKA